jgi:hypothetical protein
VKQLALIKIKILFLVMILNSSAGAETGFSLGFGFDYAIGDYGTGITADSYSTFLSLGYFPTERVDFALKIPYLYQSGSTTTTSGGVRFRTDDSKSRTGPAMGPDGGSADSGDLTEPDETRSGLGDIIFSLGYLLVQETVDWPQLRAIGFVKFPTADERRQLGTGEYDYGVGLVLSKWFDSWFLFGRGEAVFQGNDSGLGLRDFQIYEGGGGYQIGKLLPTLSVWGASSPAVGSPAQLEARVNLSYRMAVSSGISGYALKGLTDSSPDSGLGGSLFFNF